MEYLGGFIVILMFIILASLRQILSWFDRGSWAKGAYPDPNAQISNVSREQVKYAKNDAKYRTTIEFTDGYRYITHKTGREQGFLTYTIAVDAALDAEIKEDAIRKHDKDVRKKLGKEAVRTRDARPEVETAQRRQEYLLKRVQGQQAKLERTPEDAHLVKLAKKQKYGPETAYSFAFSGYDAGFARKCAVAMLDQTDPGGQLRGTMADGTSLKCTDDPQVLGDDFKVLIAEVASDGRKLRLTLRPGTETITVQAGTDISENDITLLVDRAVKIAAKL